MKIKSARVAAVAALAASLVLAGCGSEGQASADGSGECKYRIGYAEPAAAQEVGAAMHKALIAAGKHADMCVTVVDAALDVNKQLAAVNQFIAQKMDAIVVFPLSPSSLDPALTRARDAGIKVIGASAIVTDTQPDDVAPYDAIYEQNSAVGGAKLLVDYVKSELPEGGNVLGIGIGVPVPSLKFMTENYEKGIDEESGLNWLATVDNPSDDIAGGQKVAGQALTRFQGTKIDAVMAYNTSSAVGAAQATRSTPSKDAIIVGQNGDTIGIDALEAGQISAVVDLVPWRSGLMLAELIEKVLTDGEYPLLTFGRPELHTAETLADRLDWESAIDQIEAGTLTCEDGGGCPSPEEATMPY